MRGWRFGWLDEWTPDSVIKLGCDVKLKSIQEGECAGSLIT